MLVKCSWCQNTFNTDRYGRQFCPRCGAELEVPIPGGTGAPETVTVQPGEGQGPPQPAQPPPQQTAPPPQGPPPEWGWDVAGEGPQDRSAPWERRDQLGFFPSLIETWRQACLEPHRFFGRLKSEDLTSAFLYAWIVSSVGGIAGAIVGAAASLPFARWVGETSGFGSVIAELLSVPFGTAIAIWISAALVHLGCLVLGCARNGFEATFRAVAYAQGPMVLSVIPFVGWLAGMVWSTILMVIGVTHLQRTTSGRATAAVVLPGLVLFGSCGCLFAAMFALFAGGIGALLHGSMP